MSKQTRKLWRLIRRHHKQRVANIYAFPRKIRAVSGETVLLSRKAVRRALRKGTYRTDVVFYEALKCSGYFELRRTAGGQITSTANPHEP